MKVSSNTRSEESKQDSIDTNTFSHYYFPHINFVLIAKLLFFEQIGVLLVCLPLAYVALLRLARRILRLSNNTPPLKEFIEEKKNYYAKLQ